MRRSWTLAALLAVAACGPPDDPEGTLQGRFVGPVEGLLYSTPTFSGLTDEEGRFKYLLGETVRFQVGGIVLGEVEGAATVTVFDLAGVEPPVAPAAVRRAWNERTARPDATPLDVATNLAVFLYTVDNAPGKPVRISTEVHGLAADHDIDFARKAGPGEPHTFNEQVALRELLAAIHGRIPPELITVLGRTRMNDRYALDDYYEAMGLTPSLPALRTIDRNGENGSENLTFLRSGRGHTQYTSIELDGYTGEFTEYGPSGALTQYVREGVSGIEHVETYEYDPLGYRILEEAADHFDDAVNARITYDRDELGALLETEFDEDADGVADRREVYTHNDDGLTTAIEIDEDADGVIDTRVTLTWDATRRLLSRETDEGADGSVETRELHTRDERGQLLSHTLETDESSVLTTYAYDERDNLIEVTVSGGEADPTRTVYEYDELGNRKSAIEYGPDDVVLAMSHYGYDERGLLIEFTRDVGDDGDVEHEETYTYEDLDRWVAIDAPVPTPG